MRVVSTPGLLDRVAEEHADYWTRYVPPNVSDDALTDVALHILRTGRPHLLFLHLVEVDGAQHRHGLDSAEARVAIESDDRQLARVIQEIQTLGLTRQTVIVAISDHGFRPTGKLVRPCVLLKDAGACAATRTRRRGAAEDHAQVTARSVGKLGRGLMVAPCR